MLLHIKSSIKLLLAIVAVAVLASCTTLGGEAPDDNPYAEFYYPVYSVSTNQANKITRIVDIRDNTVLYENGPSDTDHAVATRNSDTGVRVPAELTLDGGEVVSGQARAIASVTDVVKLAEYFNKLDNPYGSEIPYPVDWSIDQISAAVVRDMVSNDGIDAVQFRLSDPSKAIHVENSTVADGHAKGFAAWQVEQGSPGYNSAAEYAYDFMCVKRPVVRESTKIDASANQDSGLSIKLEDEQRFNGSSVWLIEADQPCRIIRVDADGNEIPNKEFG